MPYIYKGYKSGEKKAKMSTWDSGNTPRGAVCFDQRKNIFFLTLIFQGVYRYEAQKENKRRG
jgi:hypothetical protein